MDRKLSDAAIEQIVCDVVASLEGGRPQTVKPAPETPENSYSDMTLALALEIIEGVEKKAAEIGVNAVVAISNRGANPVAVHCMDGSYIASYGIAFDKAFTVAALKMSTSTLKKLAQPGKPLYGIQFTNNQRIVIFGGGEPFECGGTVIGGIGVSGGTEEQDTFLAEYGLKLFKEAIAKK